jgi:uncharacterized protein (TIGR03435 family)
MTARRSLAVLLLAVCGFGQVPKEFEVASVKPQAPDDTRGSIQPSPGAFIANGIPLNVLIQIAYRLKDFQITNAPGWAHTDKFDVTARAPAGFIPTHQEMQPMLQALLADRFGLKVHHETREMPAFALTVNKGGPKLAQPAATDPPEPLVSIGHGIIMGKRMNMPGLADALSNDSDRIVVDRTGLSGDYDLTLKWNPDASAQDSTAVTLVTAIQEQLGLKLESVKAPVDVLVIDSVSKPSAN